MDQRPDQARERGGVARADVAGLLAFANGAFENPERARALRTGLGDIQRAEHHLEVGSMLGGEADVSDTHSGEAGGEIGVGGVAGGGQGVGELGEPGFANLTEQTGFVGEMPVGSGPRHAHAGADFAQRKRLDTFLFNQFEACFDEGDAQISMMIGAATAWHFLNSRTWVLTSSTSPV